MAGTAGLGVRRGGNAERAGLGNRFAQRSTNALWMFVFLMPAEVRRSFMLVKFYT
jgi:hypothetical protein